MKPHDAFSPSLEITEDSESESSNAKFEWNVRIKKHADSNNSQSMNVLESPAFQAKHDPDTKWSLKLYPNGCSNEFNGYASIFLFLISSKIPEMQAYLKLSISNGNDMFTPRFTRFAIFDTNTANHGESLAVVGFSKFVKSSFFTKNYNSIYGTYSIKCHIRAFPKPNEVRCSMTALPDGRLIKDLECLLNEEKLADVTIVSSSGTKIKAHKAILTTRSPVFAKMFEHEMREKCENVVRIVDLEDVVLEAVIYFIYTGKTKNLKKHAAKLMAAAEQYQLEGLKSICAEELLRGLTVNNAINTLVLADLYNMSEFKLKVIDFVNEHAKLVVDTPAFKALGQKQAYLIVEAYSILAAVLKTKYNYHCARKRRSTAIGRRRRHVRISPKPGQPG